MSRTESINGKELPESKRIFRYWVEVRELTNGSIRKLPLTALAKIHIPRSKKETQRPTEEILQLKDGSATLELKSLDDLAAQLRDRYPDGEYERTLHQERDIQAEERRSEAMNGLIKLIVESFVRSLSREDAVAFSASFKTREGKKALRELWPKIVDAYFHALRNPKR